MKLSDYLKAYHYIVSHGEHQQGKYLFAELSAWHDFDGYSCWLGYKDLTIALLFHGRCSFDYEHEDTLNAFLKKATSMLSDKANS